MSFTTDIKNFIYAVIDIALLFFVSYALLQCSGVENIATFFNVLCLAVLLNALTFNKFIYWGIFVPIVCLWTLYSPIALTNGAPTYQHLISLLATNTQEGFEFFSTIPPKHYLPAIGITFLVVVQYLFRYFVNSYNFYRKPIVLVISILLVSVTSPSLGLFHKTIKAYQDVKRDTNRIFQLTNKNSWGGGVTSSPKYNDYVLVIGESARKDYHHAYGYPIENTPFMSTSNGVLVDGLTSGGSYTIGSLRLMLTLPDKVKWEPNYDLNLIDLANTAGFSTYWLSNNSFGGSGAYPVTAIGLKAKKHFFLNPPGQSDFALLSQFKNSLSNKTKKNRLIVLDIYGSHPDFCKRVEDFPLIVEESNASSRYLNCYATSIAKTDEFLRRTHEILRKNQQETGRSFSMIYFADHGFCSSGERFLSSGKCVNMSQYSVPLFRLSSDDSSRITVKAFKSGLNFTEGLANWLGIRGSQLDYFDLFSPIADSDDYGLVKNVLKNNPRPDLWIDYRINK